MKPVIIDDDQCLFAAHVKPTSLESPDHVLACLNARLAGVIDCACAYQKLFRGYLHFATVDIELEKCLERELNE